MKEDVLNLVSDSEHFPSYSPQIGIFSLFLFQNWEDVLFQKLDSLSPKLDERSRHRRCQGAKLAIVLFIETSPSGRFQKPKNLKAPPMKYSLDIQNPGDWLYDTSYHCKCRDCGEKFFGPKRASKCWIHESEPMKEAWVASHQEPMNAPMEPVQMEFPFARFPPFSGHSD